MWKKIVYVFLILFLNTGPSNAFQEIQLECFPGKIFRNLITIEKNGEVSHLFPSNEKKVKMLSITEAGCSHINYGLIGKRFGIATITDQSITCSFEILKTNFQPSKWLNVDKKITSWEYTIDRYSGKALHYYNITVIGTSTQGDLDSSGKSLEVKPYSYTMNDNLEMEFTCNALQKKF